MWGEWWCGIASTKFRSAHALVMVVERIPFHFHPPHKTNKHTESKAYQQQHKRICSILYTRWAALFAFIHVLCYSDDAVRTFLVELENSLSLECNTLHIVCTSGPPFVLFRFEKYGKPHSVANKMYGMVWGSYTTHSMCVRDKRNGFELFPICTIQCNSALNTLRCFSLGAKPSFCFFTSRSLFVRNSKSFRFILSLKHGRPFMLNVFFCWWTLILLTKLWEDVKKIIFTQYFSFLYLFTDFNSKWFIIHRFHLFFKKTNTRLQMAMTQFELRTYQAIIKHITKRNCTILVVAIQWLIQNFWLSNKRKRWSRWQMSHVCSSNNNSSNRRQHIRSRRQRPVRRSHNINAKCVICFSVAKARIPLTWRHMEKQRMGRVQLTVHRQRHPVPARIHINVMCARKTLPFRRDWCVIIVRTLANGHSNVNFVIKCSVSRRICKCIGASIQRSVHTSVTYAAVPSSTAENCIATCASTLVSDHTSARFAQKHSSNRANS